jgi:1-acyl-sn-glycerol-3-phosphate acyltransferase
MCHLSERKPNVDNWLHRTVDNVGRFLIHHLFDLEITGLSNLPTGGPVILLCNHTNFTDIGLLMILLPRHPVGLAKEELVRKLIVGSIVSALGVISIRRGEVDREALRRCATLLAEGHRPLIIAPEGHRSGNGHLRAAHDGVTLIATRSKAIVIPVVTFGNEHFWHNVFSLRKTRVKVAIGRGFRFRTGDDRPDRAALRAMTVEAMLQLAALLPPEYRGVYNDLAPATHERLEFEPESGLAARSIA